MTKEIVIIRRVSPKRLFYQDASDMTAAVHQGWLFRFGVRIVKLLPRRDGRGRRGRGGERQAGRCIRLGRCQDNLRVESHTTTDALLLGGSTLTATAAGVVLVVLVVDAVMVVGRRGRRRSGRADRGRRGRGHQHGTGRHGHWSRHGLGQEVVVVIVTKVVAVQGSLVEAAGAAVEATGAKVEVVNRRRGKGGRVRVGLVGVGEGRADNTGGSLFTKHVESEMKKVVLVRHSFEQRV